MVCLPLLLKLFRRPCQPRVLACQHRQATSLDTTNSGCIRASITSVTLLILYTWVLATLQRLPAHLVDMPWRVNAMLAISAPMIRSMTKVGASASARTRLRVLSKMSLKDMMGYPTAHSAPIVRTASTGSTTRATVRIRAQREPVHRHLQLERGRPRARHQAGGVASMSLPQQVVQALPPCH